MSLPVDDGWLHWTFERKEPPRIFFHVIEKDAFVTYEVIDGKLKEIRRTPASELIA